MLYNIWHITWKNGSLPVTLIRPRRRPMQQANVEVPGDYPVRVRSVRGCIELTQAALAKRIGVSFATVNRWENGQSRPTRLAWQQILDLEAEMGTSGGRGATA